MVAGSERIEFISDGERDLLTDALAPSRFLSYLKSELSIARRERRAITVVSVRAMGDLSVGSNSVSGELELKLKKFVEVVAPLLRAGDHLGRISEDGFWMLIRGNRIDAEKALHRFSGTLADLNEGEWRIRYCESELEDQIENLLRRVDAIHFAK
jgi:GGDEF domain-containing protein